MDLEKRKIYVCGHKNPDTDSICSAIAYSALKNRITNSDLYVPKRAGDVNEETQYVLERFKVEEPDFIDDVGTQVKDMEIRRLRETDSSISLKKAWTIMKEDNVETLTITTGGNTLAGLITIGDIAKSYMDIYDSNILSEAKTRYGNILETIDGKMIVGSEEDCFETGKVLIAAANPDLMENYIEKDDLVILGNRYESQLCAIEMHAGSIIVCEGAPISRTIQSLAREKKCVIISTPHDTYTVARLINQSMPINHFMKKENLITFCTEDFTDNIKDIMAKKRYRDFPVIDEEGNYVGTISRRNLLGIKRKNIILVDHNEKSQAVDNIDSAEVIEIIDHHRIGTLETRGPVTFRNQPVGCTSTIIYQIYNEHNLEIPPEIAGLLCSAIISDTLMFRSPTCTKFDKEAANHLAELADIDIEEHATNMFTAGSNLEDKSPEEIFYQDFKKFSIGNITLGVGQISAMNSGKLEKIKEKLIPYLNTAYKEHRIDMLFFMLTNIIEASTELLCHGEDSKRLAEEIFDIKIVKSSGILENVVSRKKQFIPAFVVALQQ
jgi:Inorganic pyrophosphatase/exopolyphosphatase